MSLITRFISSVTEPQFMLARDLMALAVADGEITNEEKDAISTICHLEGIDEEQLITIYRRQKNIFQYVSQKAAKRKKVILEN